MLSANKLYILKTTATPKTSQLKDLYWCPSRQIKTSSPSTMLANSQIVYNYIGTALLKLCLCETKCGSEYALGVMSFICPDGPWNYLPYVR